MFRSPLTIGHKRFSSFLVGAIALAIILTHWNFFIQTGRFIKSVTSDDPSVSADPPVFRAK